MAPNRLLAVLALPAFALAFAATSVTTYLPVFINELSGPALTGALIGLEGLLALFVPVVVGVWSDRIGGGRGGRLVFLLAAAPVAAIALVLMPLAGALWLLAVLIFVFFCGYFVYYAPYRAIYPDLLPAEVSGRSQGAQKTSREIGLVMALVGGGLLLSAWRPLPFVLAAAALATITALFFVGVRGRSPGSGSDRDSEGQSALDQLRSVTRELGRDARIRWLAIANALWELALGAIKTFVVLFITIGVGRSTSFASAVLAGAAIAIIAAALTGGVLGDRLGHVRVLHVAAWVYGIGLLAPVVTQSIFVLGVVPLIAFAGGIVMTLPYAKLMELMPERAHGAASGLFELSRGVGTLLGPVIAGVAITLAEPLFADTEGYAAMWAVASAGVFVSLIPLARLRAQAEPE